MLSEDLSPKDTMSEATPMATCSTPLGATGTLFLVTKQEFEEDIFKSYKVLREFGITDAPYFIPPYEHYNATISSWARQLGLQVINYTPGTLTNGDYTTPEMKRYFSSKEILGRIWEYERTDPNGLNGHIMLIHFGTDPARTDKFLRQTAWADQGVAS